MTEKKRKKELRLALILLFSAVLLCGAAFGIYMAIDSARPVHAAVQNDKLTIRVNLPEEKNNAVTAVLLMPDESDEKSKSADSWQKDTAAYRDLRQITLDKEGKAEFTFSFAPEPATYTILIRGKKETVQTTFHLSDADFVTLTEALSTGGKTDE